MVKNEMDDKKISKVVNLICKSVGKAQIESGHAVEGVRCNGWQRLTTWIDAYDVLVFERTLAIKAVQESVSELHAIDAGILEIEKLMRENKIVRCQSCVSVNDIGHRAGYSTKGSKVKTPKHGDQWQDFSRHQWEDCGACGGTGFVRTNN